MLSAAVRRTSRDVSIMKEKLIFSGVWPRRQAQTGTGSVPSIPHVHSGVHAHSHAAHRGRDTAWTHVHPRSFTPTCKWRPMYT